MKILISNKLILKYEKINSISVTPIVKKRWFRKNQTNWKLQINFNKKNKQWGHNYYYQKKEEAIKDFNYLKKQVLDLEELDTGYNSFGFDTTPSWRKNEKI